jgi:hypothetical protein
MYPTPQSSPWGETFFQNLQGNVTFNNPTSGRTFYVAKASITNAAEIAATYGSVSYPDGTPALYTTVKLALAQCLANRGDTIVVMSGHTENITGATDLAISIAGVTIVGLGQGTMRPTFTWTTAIGANIPISAANVSISNCIFDGTGFDAITTMFTVTAAGVTFRKNTFITANVTNQIAIGITTSALATYFTFDNNTVAGTGDAGTTNFLQLVGGDDAVITNNYMYGAYTTSLGPINQITTAGLRMLIANNTLVNATASSTKAIVLVAGSTGFIRDNRIGILSGTAAVTAAGMYVAQNISLAAVSVGAVQTQV